MTSDEEILKEYVKREFVDSGFINVLQWRNFIDYLNILIKKEKKLAREDEAKKFEERIEIMSKYPIRNGMEGALDILELKKKILEKRKQDELEFLKILERTYTMEVITTRIRERIKSLETSEEKQ